MIDDDRFPIEGKIFALESLGSTLSLLVQAELRVGNDDAALHLQNAAASLSAATRLYQDKLDATKGDNVVSLDKHRKK